MLANNLFVLSILQSAVLPVLSGWVLVLLKLLLATVSAGTSSQPPLSTTSSVFPPGVTSRKETSFVYGSVGLIEFQPKNNSSR